MVQIVIKIPDSDDAVDEWAMVELQGDLETRVKDDSLIDKFIGHLHFTKQKNEPVFIVGHHILYGKVSKMSKPLLVLRKHLLNNNTSKMMDTSEMMDTSDSELASSQSETSYNVSAIISKKIVFKTRPNPIVANVPKTI